MNIFNIFPSSVPFHTVSKITEADNPEQPICCFNEPRNDQVYNVFISERIKSGNFEKGIYFKIDQVKSKTGNKTFSAKQKLERNGSGND